MKGESATILYGEEAKDGVIIITTKTKYNSVPTLKPKPLIYINGLHSSREIKDIDPDSIVSISVWKEAKAIEKFGDNGKNGVIEVTLKNKNQKY